MYYGSGKKIRAVCDEYPGIGSPDDLYHALLSVWSADTCAPRMRKDWSKQNPTLGQCSITAFLAQDIFGGKVFGVPLDDGNFHCYNCVDGEIFDLTSEQFPYALDYSDNPEQFRGIHFAKEEKKQRYDTLKAKLNSVLAEGKSTFG